MYSVGPDVALDNQYLDMGVVESGKFVAKSFKIFNNTDVPAAFQVNYQKFRMFVVVVVNMYAISSVLVSIRTNVSMQSKMFNFQV